MTDVISTGNATRDRIRMARDSFRQNVAASAPQQAPAPVSVPEQPVQAQVPVPEPQIQTPAPMPVQPVYNYNYDAELAAAREESARLRQELDNVRQQRAADEAARKSATDELARYKEDQELQQFMAGQGDFGSINPDDAKKIIAPLMKTFKQDRDRLQKQVEATQQAVQQRFSNYATHQANATRQKQCDTIMHEFPDLAAMQQHPAYARVMQSPVGPGSSITVGQMVAGELTSGNTDYAINVLKQIKQQIAGGAQSSGGLAQVSSVGATAPAANAPVAGQPAAPLSYDELAELRHQLRTKQISRGEFQERMAKHREAVRAS